MSRSGAVSPAVTWSIHADDVLPRRLRDAMPSADGPPCVHVVWSERALTEAEESELLAADIPVLLGGPTVERLTPGGLLAVASGLGLAGRTPEHAVRVRAGTDPSPLAPPADTHADLIDRVVLVEKVADDVEVLLTAQVGSDQHPMATVRRSTGVAVFTPRADRDGSLDPVALRLLAGVLRQVAGAPSAPSVRVALLGYGAIGHEHAEAVRAVHGLELALVCDRSPDRLASAQAVSPYPLRTTTDSEAVVCDPGTDLVVISTPPDTHAAWALRALEAGKHVVVEKPFALTTAEADEVLVTAADRGLIAVVYQNRRFDPDHLALREVVRSGTIGKVFSLEAFVGGYDHPCNYWHSQAAVSGGAVFDWGAHVIDQVLDLMPGDIAHVTAAEHKLVWHDVTNADHTRVTIRYVDGSEAEFVHSDLSAAMKPRWYVLGARGAVVGHWRTERAISRTSVGTLAEDVLAPADSPPRLTLHDARGSVTELALPDPPPHAFHQELADLLTAGLPMSVTGAQSRRVLAVMEAARESARQEGRPVELR